MKPAPAKPMPPAGAKPGAPKKETTRIQVPPEPKTMPKATVKLQQTVPMAPMPAPAIHKAPEAPENDGQQDPLLVRLGVVAALTSAFAAVAAVLAFLAFN